MTPRESACILTEAEVATLRNVLRRIQAESYNPARTRHGITNLSGKALLLISKGVRRKQNTK